MSSQKFNPAVSSTIAIRDADGKYMKVTSTNGLEFTSADFDDNAIFTVVPRSSGKIALVGSNGKYVNMYYVDDVKCEGPGGGLAVGLYNRPLRRVNLTISGYSGQDGKTYFLSNLPGNESYHGSLAVAKTENEHCRFRIEPITKINVTGVITLRNQEGCYMKVTESGGLTCTSSVADDNAKFTVKRSGSKLALIGKNGKYVNMYYVDDVKCEGPGGGLTLGVGYNGDGTVFLTISGYQGQNGATYFLSSEPGNASYNGSLAVKRCAVDTCRFYIDSVAQVSGTIALRDSHGAYLRVTNDKGLVFSHGAVDDNAKFTVKQDGNKVNLIGVGYGSYVNMYGIKYVQCKGPSGGLALGVNTLVNGLVRLSISGYQGQDGKTAYLSSRAGEAKESLLVASDGSDASCRFVVENY
ncbi:hypothetical protein Moror_16132 [Moniliophthora roreri MCA 2997]|uniref:Uncharacterized protein n=1 Tax=Moniliophthora roreri (strain MCA 2997) TaxID=1381753 RepID=V2WRI0_MONRO|nr:hypothetical protein Moror_16132 [Moniliophthora roreri MCA 2997]